VIVDRLENAELYSGLGETLAAGLRFLQDNDVAAMAPGRREIAGEDLFAMVQEYEPKPAEQGLWEAHRRYIDIQYIARGVERIGYANVCRLAIQREYDADNDAMFLEGQGDLFMLREGMFAIFWPEDAHMPGLEAESRGQVKKVVVKVKID